MCCLGVTPLYANEVDDFIRSAQVKTYDCPDDDQIKQLDSYLEQKSMTAAQSIQLQVIQAQGLICIGQYNAAQDKLHALMQNPAMQKESYSYASAHYQLGFILDIQEDPARCEYYTSAESLARDKFNDIFLSAQLGLLTVCAKKNQEISFKLGRLYTLIEKFMLKGDLESVAHIHNNIGLLYGDIGQNALAAEQYLKAYEIGLSVYEPKNQIAPLISVISAYMGSGDFDNAKKMIDELDRANLKVNTPLSNSWLRFAQSRYFYQTGKFELMRNSMRKWKVYFSQVSDSRMESLFAWYQTALCLVDKDRECVTQFLQQRETEDAIKPTRLSRNKDYLRFLVEANLFLGNIDKTSQAFNQYANTLADKIRAQQSSARVLGVAKLHGEIIALEATLAESEKRHIQTILIILITFLVVILLLYFTLGRKYIRKLSTDPLTGLRNEQSALAEIKRVKTPVKGKINALALFDMTNFTAVNSQFGYLAGELLIKKVASCLTQVTREKDIIGRLGADQFIVCLVNLNDNVATELFERIHKVLTEVVFNAEVGEKVNVDSSMSMYLAQEGFNDLELIIEDMRKAHLEKNKR